MRPATQALLAGRRNAVDAFNDGVVEFVLARLPAGSVIPQKALQILRMVASGQTCISNSHRRQLPSPDLGPVTEARGSLACANKHERPMSDRSQMCNCSPTSAKGAE